MKEKLAKSYKLYKRIQSLKKTKFNKIYDNKCC